jgi:HNH endonuclease
VLGIGETMAKRLQGKDRIYEKVDLNTQHPKGCWIWKGGKRRSGKNPYGCLSVKDKTTSAHRYSYEVFKGTIPLYKVVMHTCDETLCVNPDHLRLDTQLKNMEDMRKKARQARPSGLNFQQCEEIRKLAKDFGMRELARRFGVSHTTIIGIVHNKYRVIS